MLKKEGSMLDWQRTAKALRSNTVFEALRRSPAFVAVLAFLAGNMFTFVLQRMAVRADAELAQENARKEHIRDEVVRWSNPILNAIGDLQDRLKNI
jgi:hypothetical protein